MHRHPAPPRGSSRRVVVAALLLLLVGGGGGLILTAVLGTPAVPVVSTDYGARLGELARRGLPEDATNAWPDLERSIDALREAARSTLPPDEREEADAPEGDVEWALAFAATQDAQGSEATTASAEDRARAEAALDAYLAAGGRDAWRTAAAGDLIDLGPAGDPATTRLVELPRFAQLAPLRRLAVVHAGLLRRAMREGRADEAAIELDALLEVGRLVARQPTMVECLVGVAIREVAHGAVREAIGGAAAEARAIDSAVLGALARVLDDHALPSPARPPLDAVLAFEGERLFALDAVQWCYTDDGRGNGRLVPSRLATLTTGGPATDPEPADVVGIFTPDRRTVTAAIEERFDDVIRRAALPRCERLGIPWSGPSEAARKRIGPLGILLLDTTDQMLDRLDASAARLRGTAILVAIERHRASQGTLPETLDALVPDFLALLPADPLGCGPWGYRVDPDVLGGYRLWSWGEDAEDDGGTSAGPRDREGDEVLAPLTD